jgi:hypothetical protein
MIEPKYKPASTSIRSLRSLPSTPIVPSGPSQYNPIKINEIYPAELERLRLPNVAQEEADLEKFETEMRDLYPENADAADDDLLGVHDDATVEDETDEAKTLSICNIYFLK